MPCFEVQRDDLHTTRVVDDAPRGDLAEGEALLRVERFGYTANNITYGALGDMLGYWQFFAAADGWGRIPVWGFGEVVESAADGIAAGQRYYGYFPPASTVTMRPQAAGPGMVETAPHRAELPAVYNRYIDASLPGLEPEHEAANMVLRPLFMTGWLIADQLEEADWYGAGAIVISSASSKTSYSTAFELARRDGGPAVVGLTSQRNRDFVEGLDLYDKVVTYDEVGTLDREDGLVFVDMAGSAELRARVHTHAADALKASITVGATHWDQISLEGGELPGATPEFFFAPTRIEARSAAWGAGGLQERIGAGWSAFLGPAAGILEIEEDAGPEAVERVHRSFLDGTADPSRGYVLSLPG